MFKGRPILRFRFTFTLSDVYSGTELISNNEVKQHWPRLVTGWVTTSECPRSGQSKQRSMSLSGEYVLSLLGSLYKYIIFFTYLLIYVPTVISTKEAIFN